MACKEQRSDHGDMVAMTIANGKQVLAKIYSCTSADFINCVKCGFVPLIYYKLNCQHCICTHCAVYGRSYLCVTDNITTNITKPAVPYTALKRAGFQCPACCRLFRWGDIWSHIQNEHPDLWKEGNADTWSDTQMGEDPNTMNRVVPDTQNKPSSIAEASTSSVPHAGPVLLGFPTQALPSSACHADPMALDVHTQELKSTVQRLKSADEENRSTMATYEENLYNANTFCFDVEEVPRKHKSEWQITPMFRYTWTLRPYSALWQDLVVNNASLSTGVLSVNPPGYKVELMINITGHTCEWRRHWLKDEMCCPPAALQVAFMVRLHHGEHDDLLTWPFTNKIELALVNHLDDEKSIRQELESSEADGDSVQKPVPGTPNKLFGFPRVISVLKLHTPEEGFLFHDSIVFTFSIY
ncbi:uncharacterized protein LOC144142807 isoform X2 [Haemaphysalis longicornis]